MRDRPVQYFEEQLIDENGQNYNTFLGSNKLMPKNNKKFRFFFLKTMKKIGLS